MCCKVTWQRVFAILSGRLVNILNFKYCGVVSKDHVHVLVSVPPTMSPSEIMRRVNGRISRKIFEEFPHVKKHYWGRHFWARGYFCVTAGELTKKIIKEYLAHHFERDPNDGFGVEA